MTTSATRRYDLDWLRIIAFGLLIFYHIGMFYVTWGWHVKSDHAGPAIEPLMLLVNPWRLDLLFFISGVATVFLAEKLGALRLAGSRFTRLFWPLLFGMAVIVPPQSYYEIVSDIQFSGGYLDFYGKYLTAYNGWCDQDGCLTVPTWNHLWYVAYLLAYSLIFAVLWPLLKRIPLGWAARLPAPVYFALPIALYWFAQAVLQRQFEDTHAFVGDWTVHTHSFGFFLLGALSARFDRLFDIAAKSRWLSLAIGLIAYGLLNWLRHLFYAKALPWPFEVAWAIGSFTESCQAVFMMFALLGFARRHLANSDGPIRRTLTEAIFPFYIVHQTLIVVFAYNLNQLHLPATLEATILVIATAAGCWLSYLVIRAIPPLRPLLGLTFSRGKNTASGNA
ncbi:MULTISPECIES: acyltransferase family protein [Asticcacaulis]|uniref:acyltransferase family protein n=1 Tax=Asticcacaulis TaxID=76890 RepID=UPI001AE14CA1|nr:MULTISPECIES: acyltransferase family protein [Asticcacaulis]MBP2160851.1 peptidoglycan/LPS O-acetylase OafA/YrhL [Asticcacaulis solisilvae]MDR6801945.1 peptidoglycan/LPS O-acetylase OafA/YrhL [Asticcacaulis sp. BE141]